MHSNPIALLLPSPCPTVAPNAIKRSISEDRRNATDTMNNEYSRTTPSGQFPETSCTSYVTTTDIHQDRALVDALYEQFRGNCRFLSRWSSGSAVDRIEKRDRRPTIHSFAVTSFFLIGNNRSIKTVGASAKAQ
ncbi:hypothetical protein HN011_006384 [Eciton burchellii]|nr:hypothetical protein HN011_006384 [Eciton burchellii]